MIFVDTCVLLDVVTRPTEWTDWSERMLASWSTRGALGINDIVFAEFCAGYELLNEVEGAVEAMGLDVLALPREALFLASKAHRLYRRRGGHKVGVLPDFLIGAHAAVLRIPVLTRDPSRFTYYFSGLEVLSPACQ